MAGVDIEDGGRFEGYFGEELEGSFCVDAIERATKCVIVEAVWVDGGAEEQFGVLTGDEFLDFVERTPAR